MERIMDTDNTKIYAKGTKKNFPDVKKTQYYSLDEIRQGDCSGMTETDSVTSGKSDGMYTHINRTSGKPHG